MDSGSVAPKGRIRQVRHSREALRELMLSAGRDILVEDGLGIGPETLTFKKAFARVEARTGIRITNASVIGRVWTNQEEYRSEVVGRTAAAILNAESDLLDDDYVRLYQGVVDVLGQVDLSTTAGRQSVLREMIRQTNGRGAGGQNDGPSTAVRTIVWMMAAFSGPETRSNEQLQASYGQVLAAYMHLDQQVASTFGVRLRPGLSLRTFSQAHLALIEGSVVRRGVSEEPEPALLPTGPGGSLQEWNHVALSTEALVRLYFEVDPEFPS